MNSCYNRLYKLSGKWVYFRYLLFAAVSTLGILNCRAQTFPNINIEKVEGEGLSNNYIICINQDKNGFMWFGTREGLFKYDGYNFKPFKNIPGDPGTLAGNAIQCLYAEKNNLWAGTIEGISVVDINTGIVKNYAVPSSTRVNCIFPKNDWTFWIGTTVGVYQFNKKTLIWKKIKLVENDPSTTSIYDDKKGHTWFTAYNGFYCYTKSTGHCVFYEQYLPSYPNIEHAKCAGFCQSNIDSAGNIWSGTWDGGLAKFNTKTLTIKQWFHATDDLRFLPYKIVTDVLPRANGTIWLANKEGGLTIFDPLKNKFSNFPVEWDSKDNISGAVVSLFRDAAGTTWIGTENGIFKYDHYDVHLSKTNILSKTSSGLVHTHSSPTAILKDKRGLWWIGMYEGIYTFDPRTHILTDKSKAFGIEPNLRVFNILQADDGSIWFSAGWYLVKLTKQPANKTSYKVEVFKSPAITSTICQLYIDKEKRMWIGTHKNGMFRFDGATNKFINYNYHEIGTRGEIKEIHCFYELSKDSMLVGGVSNGLMLLHANTGRYEKIDWGNTPQVPADISINEICKDGNDLWIGTEYNGLLKTNTKLVKPTVLSVANGLPSMGITSMQAGNNHDLWMLTNSGAVQFSLTDKKMTIFDKKDGILNLDELNALLIEKQGGVVIGSRGCFYDLASTHFTKNIQPPKVFITNLKVFDDDHNVLQRQRIELNYDQNYFTLEYVALNYTQSRLNRYAYRMDGLDTSWNDAGMRRYISFANLKEGTYKFKVRACNNEGIWNNSPAEMIIVIKPPFWHMWWFYVIIIILIAGTLYFIYSYNMNQLKIRQRLRNKIARDLHDDIGSTLSGINIFSKMALQNTKVNEGSQELLERISEWSGKTMDALSDIVWSINTKNDTMDNLVARIRECLAELLEPQNIHYTLNFDTDITQLKLGMELIKEFYMIFKEAVCNALKYSDCTGIDITITKEKHRCFLTVSDNGKGFDIQTVKLGNGIENMYHRAEKMNGKLQIISKPGKGTTIILSFNIPRFR